MHLVRYKTILSKTISFLATSKSKFNVYEVSWYPQPANLNCVVTVGCRNSAVEGIPYNGDETHPKAVEGIPTTTNRNRNRKK